MTEKKRISDSPVILSTAKQRKEMSKTHLQYIGMLNKQITVYLRAKPA